VPDEPPPRPPASRALGDPEDLADVALEAAKPEAALAVVPEADLSRQMPPGWLLNPKLPFPAVQLDPPPDELARLIPAQLPAAGRLALVLERVEFVTCWASMTTEPRDQAITSREIDE
jgi:hypothetical protein